MQVQSTHNSERTPSPVMPWSLRSWPPLLWQANQPMPLAFRHIGTRVMVSGDAGTRSAGQTIWGGSAAGYEAGVAWDWVEISTGIVAMADPMSVITNLRIVGEEGRVLTALEAALFLNCIVRTLPWQHEVERALQTCH